MSQLINLPTEILRQILQYREDHISHQRDMCSISLTCHHLRTLARPLIFQEIHQNFCISDGITWEAFLLLIRSLEEYPPLSSMIRWVDLQWSDPQADVYEKVNIFLGKLTCLLELDLMLPARYHDGAFSPRAPPYSPDFLEVNKMPLLRKLSVHDNYMESTVIIQYLFIESLRDFSFSNINLGGHSFALPTSLMNQKSNITKLHFRNLSVEDMQLLLSWTPSLQDLTCYVAGVPDSYFMVPGWDQYTGPIIPLSPFKTLFGLSPVLDTLESLYMIIPNIYFCDWDGTKLDLSNATRLKSATLPANCVFPPDESMDARMGFWKLLPHSLERLELHFKDDLSIINPCHSAKFLRSELYPTEHPPHLSELSWLMELLALKSNVTPALRYIQLTEEVELFDDWSGEFMKQWDLPTVLRVAAGDAGVHVSIWVGKRIPNGFQRN